MAKKLALYGFLLIGGYIVAGHLTGFGQLIGSTSNGAGTLVRDFQGR